MRKIGLTPAAVESAMENNTLRVLYFEDCADDVELSLQLLRSSGFDVTADVAVTSEQFLERVRSSSYDVVLSDYLMPHTTGMEIFELLKGEGLNIPFILVTGALGDEKAVECVREGVADCVLKERLVRLPVAVRRALGEHRLRMEREAAVDALRRSEASYRSLINSAPCGILRLNALNGQLVEVNPAMAETLGYASPGDLLASGTVVLSMGELAGLTAPQSHPGQIVKAEVHWRRKDGLLLTIGLSGRLLRDENGVAAYLEMIADDITARRSAETRIGLLNRLYSVLSHAGQAIVRIREAGELFQAICRILTDEGQFKMAWIGMVEPGTGLVTPAATWPGDEEEYLTGLNITVHDEPAGRGPVGTAIRQSRHVVCNDLAMDSAMQPWWERAQRRGYRSMGAYPIVVSGQATGAIAIYSDEVGFFDEENIALLDELAANLSFALESIEVEQMRQRAVEELNQFFTLSLDMLCISGMDGCMRRVNRAWENTLGFTAAELCSKPWIEFVHPDDRARAETAFSGLQSGVEFGHLELRFLSKSGGYKWLIGSATPVLQLGVIFAAVSDITERKHLEGRLRSQNLELEEQNRQVQIATRMKSEFLANMSHELRSPLNGVIGFSALLYDGKLGPLAERPREFVGRIHSSATHLLHLINGVLDLSKVEAGRIELRPEQVVVSDVIREVIGVLAAVAAAKQILIHSEPEVQAYEIYTDPGKLRQILHNYLSNALKFTEPGGHIVVRSKAEGATEFRLEVADSGIGIAEEDISRLFIEFQQLNEGKAKRHQGTGLGLALTKRIVEAQGGRVGVESAPGQGSTFFAVLPRTPPSNPAADGAANILVIEDEKVEGFLMTRILAGAGYKSDIATTCAEALEKCRQTSFDAITLDLLLPDGQGWDLFHQIRSLGLHRETPVIVVSMLGEGEVAFDDDVQGYLTKPVKKNELLELMERAGVERAR